LSDGALGCVAETAGKTVSIEHLGVYPDAYAAVKFFNQGESVVNQQPEMIRTSCPNYSGIGRGSYLLRKILRDFQVNLLLGCEKMTNFSTKNRPVKGG
jgi:hypothetical protein